MRRVHINLVKTGEKLARPILRENGNVLLGAGIELNDKFIDRLRDMGIDMLYIEDGNTTDIIPDEIIRDETRKSAVETIYKSINTMMDTPATRGRAVAPEL